MKKTIQVSGYTPMGNMQEPADTAIFISGDIERAVKLLTAPGIDPQEVIPSSMETASAVFDRDAELIFQTLRDSLPGGTMDRLVGKLLAYKASHFYVNHECHQIKDNAR